MAHSWVNLALFLDADVFWRGWKNQWHRSSCLSSYLNQDSWCWKQPSYHHFMNTNLICLWEAYEDPGHILWQQLQRHNINQKQRWGAEGWLSSVNMSGLPGKFKAWVYQCGIVPKDIIGTDSLWALNLLHSETGEEGQPIPEKMLCTTNRPKQ